MLFLYSNVTVFYIYFSKQKKSYQMQKKLFIYCGVNVIIVFIRSNSNIMHNVTNDLFNE